MSPFLQIVMTWEMSHTTHHARCCTDYKRMCSTHLNTSTEIKKCRDCYDADADCKESQKINHEMTNVCGRNCEHFQNDSCND